MRVILLSLCLVASISAFAQNDDNPNSLEGVPFSERLYVGGDLGLQFGNSTVINISPILGYKLNKKWSAGVGAKYMFLRYRDPWSTWEYTSSIYGGSVFTRYLLGQNFVAHAEFETLNTEVWELFATESSRRWVPMGFLGLGYRQGVGNTYFQLMALYDVINDRYSPYRNQYILGPDIPVIIRGGVVIGLGG